MNPQQNLLAVGSQFLWYNGFDKLEFGEVMDVCSNKKKMIAPIIVTIIMVLYYVVYFGFLMTKTPVKDVVSIIHFKKSKFSTVFDFINIWKEEEKMKTFIIAEIGINHNGDMELVKKLIIDILEQGGNNE